MSWLESAAQAELFYQQLEKLAAQLALIERALEKIDARLDRLEDELLAHVRGP